MSERPDTAVGAYSLVTRSVLTRKFALAAVFVVALGLEVYTLGFHKTSHVEAKGAHQTLVREFGMRVPIGQTFTMRSDGLQAVRVLFWSAARCELTFDWMLSEQQASGTLLSIVGHRRQLGDLSGYRWDTLSFPAIPKSAGKTYKLDVRVSDVQAPIGQELPATAIVASLDNSLRPGFLTVGSRERWGDLEFDTRAAGDTLLGRFLLITRPTLPAALQSIPVLGAIFLMYHLCLAAFLIHFAPVGPRATENAAPRLRFARLPSSGRPGIRAALTVVCLLASLTAVYAQRGRPIQIDLIDELWAAELRSPRQVHDTFEVVEKDVFSDPIRALIAHPDAQVKWTLTIPRRSRLRTALVIDPGAWVMPGGDGVVFRIGVREHGEYTELFMRHIDPARVVADRRWTPVDLDLSAFAGQRIDLIFQTDSSLPGHPWDSSYDWALWGAPRITAD
jgi:hypothetical protein